MKNQKPMLFQKIAQKMKYLKKGYLKDNTAIEVKNQKLYEGAVGQVKARLVVKKQGDVDIGCGNAFGGVNQDQQQGGNNGEAPPEKVIDLVDAFQYCETSFGDVDGFNDYFKVYMKKVMEKVKAVKPQRVDTFKNGALQFWKWVKQNFDQLSFWCPSTYDVENLLVISHYKNEEDEAPTFLYIMDGLKEEKF